MLRLKLTDLAAVGLVCLLLVPSPGNRRAPGPAPAPPPAELAALVAPVGELLRGNPQRGDWAGWCLAAADCVRRDAGARIQKAEQLRAAIDVAVSLRFKEAFARVPGLAAACNEVMLAWVGKEAGELTPQRRARAVEALEALGWAAR